MAVIEDEWPARERGPNRLPGLLIDLDGVIYQSERIIDGALQTLDWIRQRQIPHLFVTNTTSRSRVALLEKFEHFGFAAELDELMTPIVAANQYIERRQFGRIAAFVTASAASEFSEVEVVAPQSAQAVDAVVIGDLGEAWDYRTLNSAFRLLMQDPAPQLIALGMTRYWRGADGLLLDVAPFVSALENAAGCKALVFGKPADAFFSAALQRLQCPRDDTYMIGDDIAGDTGAAQQCGIRGIQVKTGKFREADLQGDIKPFALLDSIADLPPWWTENVDAPGAASTQ
jgi:HAD superfamily hydrolase (TIGR01458 family)